MLHFVSNLSNYLVSLFWCVFVFLSVSMLAFLILILSFWLVGRLVWALSTCYLPIYSSHFFFFRCCLLYRKKKYHLMLAPFNTVATTCFDFRNFKHDMNAPMHAILCSVAAVENLLDSSLLITRERERERKKKRKHLLLAFVAFILVSCYITFKSNITLASFASIFKSFSIFRLAKLNLIAQQRIKINSVKQILLVVFLLLVIESCLPALFFVLLCMGKSLLMHFS